MDRVIETQYDDAVRGLMERSGAIVNELEPPSGDPDHAKFRPIGDFVNRVSESQKGKRDEMVRESQVRLDKNLRLPDGSPLTPHALNQLGRLAGMQASVIGYFLDRGRGYDLAKNLNADMNYREKERLIARRSMNVERARNGNTDPLKTKDAREMMLRRRPYGDGEIVRAILSEKYAVIENDFVLNLIDEVAPNGGISSALASYAFDDGDSVGGNLMFPDDVRVVKDDSEYRFGVSFRNDEVGRYKFTMQPFLFRSFCWNGCIFGREDSAYVIDVRHYGEIDVRALREATKRAMTNALAAGESLFDQMKFSRDVPVMNAMQVILALSLDYNLDMKEAKDWYQGYQDEVGAGAPPQSAFSVVNGLTRAAGSRRGHERLRMESAAGRILAPTLESSEEMVKKAWSEVDRKAAASITDLDKARVSLGIITEAERKATKKALYKARAKERFEAKRNKS